ncbi:hypothetical protein GCM10012275_01300 [Longimycelium tulufanense]|uniref:Alpha-1,2-mannosyltransferase n=1 Tax=Longimycelium tulufanense TaxID=907463 RepID=A0A8J3C9D4_9PSEU|nr:glycosyltransferase family 87 protein [Longimycelium tulufanense]GGM33633.1 hypothetical protein GCM10012275_01300 [Longimycelium tulufanense]
MTSGTIVGNRSDEGEDTPEPERRRLVVPAAAVIVAGIAAVAGVLWSVFDLPLGVDLAVYRSGALAVLHGEALYEPLRALPNSAQGLPFTYPPVAALLFLPLVLVPWQVATGLLGAASILALGLAIRLALDHEERQLGGRAVTALVLAALVLAPVRDTLGLGQINLVLMGLVMVDVLTLRGSRWSGVLTGVAAAIKLTPLIFVPHLFLVGRRADAARAIATFLGLNVAATLLLPGDTWKFWASAMLGGNKATANGWPGNQSVNGLVHRLVGDGPRVLAAVAVVSIGCLIVAAMLVRRPHREGRPLDALLGMAMCGLVISPISWPHHWVWVVPLLVVLLCRMGTLGGWLLLSALAVVFTVVSLYFFTVWDVHLHHHQGPAWVLPHTIASNAYLVAAAISVLAVVRTTRTVSSPGWRRRDPRFGERTTSAMPGNTK